MELPDATRKIIYERDNRQCQACGIALGSWAWKSVQHRKARGVGGTNDLSNLVLLCGSATSRGCHRLCEDRDQGMRDRGFWVPSWDDPAAIPVVRFDGSTVYLLADGCVRY